MTDVATPEIDFAKREDELRARLGELEEQRQGLALDAIGDADNSREQLAAVESELAETAVELDRLGLAAVEAERREAAAKAEAESQAQQEAFAAAQHLQVEREKHAKAIDEAIDEFVQAMRAHTDVCAEQHHLLLAAGQEAAAGVARPRGFYIEGAFALAMRKAGRLPALERLPMIPPMHQRPLVESDPKPVSPPGKGE
ncbi:MAG TPA: hypothetical protein VFI03_12245 [Solirubrobacterales bacterium]|nr:hypothetical protein [Solirubrobacterales bacterium]